MVNSKPNTIDEYIATFPKKTQLFLQQIRTTIQKAAPKAIEVISYGMPAFKLNGILVYFAGYQNHIGFYAAPIAHEAFKKEFSIYKTGKGSVQFPLDSAMPLGLITKVVKYRVKQNLEKELSKTKKKSTKNNI